MLLNGGSLYNAGRIFSRLGITFVRLSFPILLRILFASQPQLLSPILKIIHRAISTFLIKQAGLKVSEGHTGAATLIQRFGSAANLNMHLHCLCLDGVYRQVEDKTVFESVIKALVYMPTLIVLPPPAKSWNGYVAVSHAQHWLTSVSRSGKMAMWY